MELSLDRQRPGPFSPASTSFARLGSHAVHRGGHGNGLESIAVFDEREFLQLKNILAKKTTHLAAAPAVHRVLAKNLR